jgi:4-hydroxy-3-polyprenylbenzoate decarboxylase
MRLIVGITGASGAKLGVRLCEELSKRGVDVHVVITDAGIKVGEFEVGKDVVDKLKKVSNRLFFEDDLDAPIASGSYPVDGMVIIPCSMNTVAKIAYGLSDNLLLRAVDVQLKMGRRLVIVPRESPLSATHLRNLLRLQTLYNNIYIIFPLLTYYHNPKTIEEMENYTLGRILDMFGLEHNLYRRWRVDEE